MTQKTLNLINCLHSGGGIGPWTPLPIPPPPSPQAPKKAKRRAVAEGGSSNVFSMFDQTQIQEFKEVSKGRRETED